MPRLSEKDIPPSVEPPIVPASPELIQKIEESIAWSKKVFENQEKVKHYLQWIIIGDVLKVILVIVPLILAALLLPSLIKSFSAAFGGSGGTDASNALTEMLQLYTK